MVGFEIYNELDFNPRTSCEVRLLITSGCGLVAIFQSTHLV